VIVGSGQLLDLPGQLRPLWHVASLAAAEDTPKDLLPEGFDNWLTTEGADVGVVGLAQESAESFATEFIRGRFPTAVTEPET
jgi:hypothetical protein